MLMLKNFIAGIVTLLPLLLLAGKTEPPSSVTETITIIVKASGNATVSGVSSSLDAIHTAIEKKLWKKYLATGKMQDRLKLQFIGEVLMGVRGASMDELLLAQQDTLKKLCLKKYSQDYDQLTAARQSYIKRKFPILFQQIS
jgi:hypothetical protein